MKPELQAYVIATLMAVTSFVLWMLFAAALLVGCADHVTFAEASQRLAAQRLPGGFWSGLWHGMILPFSWFGSLFDESIAIYAIYNNGGWYDFGYALGVALTGGGSKAAS